MSATMRAPASMHMTATALRAALTAAIDCLPRGRTPQDRRDASRNWHRQVLRRAFERRPEFLVRENVLLSNLATGATLSSRAIDPTIVPCVTKEDFLIFAYFALWSSFPTHDRPGRRLKFLVRDVGHPDQPLIGICCLSSPVRQVRSRDEWIGWSGSEYRMSKVRNLVHVTDLSTCVSLPPYSSLTGGKLLAGLMTTNEVRALYHARYCHQLTRSQRRHAHELFLLTTSGCYGSNTPQYKGLKCDGDSLYQFIGYSRGYSHFQIGPDLYEEVKAFVIRRRPDTKGLFRTWSNSKLRVLRLAARALGIPEELLVFTGHRRGMFASTLDHNWRDLLLGRSSRRQPVSRPAASIAQSWKRDWLPRRLGDPAVIRSVLSFEPHHARISSMLAHDNDHKP
jgi:hypothetical protein